ncbi:hypothetical protein NC651_026188 [Populus alba x Populus x berolinensis]|nr:hypothetical protein NC651_026188 [Populus alba x Populus x berolinensis]
MDRPQRISTKEPQAILSPCSSRSRRPSSDSNSPEFEFWIQNLSFPQPNLVSADELLLVDGALLRLHLLHHPDPDSTEPKPPNSQTNPEPESSPTSITMEPTTSSKSWEAQVELLIPPSLPSDHSHRLLHSVLKKEAKMGFVRVYTKPQLCGVGHALQDEVAVYFSLDILSNFLKI